MTFKLQFSFKWVIDFRLLLNSLNFCFKIYELSLFFPFSFAFFCSPSITKFFTLNSFNSWSGHRYPNYLRFSVRSVRFWVRIITCLLAKFSFINYCCVLLYLLGMEGGGWFSFLGLLQCETALFFMGTWGVFFLILATGSYSWVWIRSLQYRLMGASSTSTSQGVRMENSHVSAF